MQLILDTDLGFDVDDVGAIAVANYFQDIGEAEILCMVHNTGFYKGVGGIDVINSYYGRNHTTIPIGAYKGAWGSSDDAQASQDKYTSTIENDYPSQIQNYDQVESAVSVYEECLSKAEDGSVVIASIGELTNLRDIIEANKSLFVQKVNKVLYMDGGYNFGCGDSDGTGKILDMNIYFYYIYVCTTYLIFRIVNITLNKVYMEFFSRFQLLFVYLDLVCEFTFLLNQYIISNQTQNQHLLLCMGIIYIRLEPLARFNR